MFQSRKKLTMNRPAIILGAGLTAIIVTYGSRAEAQNEAQYEEARKEIAEKKSAEAQIELTAGNVSKACQLYEVAEQLDPTPLHKSDLYDCLKRVGQYVTAAEQWRKVANTLTGRDADYAFDQAKQLEMEAPCLIVDVPSELQKIPDLEVSIDGQAVPRASWGTRCTMVNACEHTISAKAQNKGWPHQRVSTMAARTQYRVTIARPTWDKPPVAPTAPENPVNRAIFTIPGVSLLGVGLGTLLLATQATDVDSKSAGTIAGICLMGSGAFVLSAGAIVYVMATPTPAEKSKSAAFSGATIGVIGRF